MPFTFNSTAFTNSFGGLGNAVNDLHGAYQNLTSSGASDLTSATAYISLANATLNIAGEITNINKRGQARIKLV